MSNFLTKFTKDWNIQQGGPKPMWPPKGLGPVPLPFPWPGNKPPGSWLLDELDPAAIAAAIAMRAADAKAAAEQAARDAAARAAEDAKLKEIPMDFRWMLDKAESTRKLLDYVCDQAGEALNKSQIDYAAAYAYAVLLLGADIVQRPLTFSSPFTVETIKEIAAGSFGSQESSPEFVKEALDLYDDVAAAAEVIPLALASMFRLEAFVPWSSEQTDAAAGADVYALPLGVDDKVWLAMANRQWPAAMQLAIQWRSTPDEGDQGQWRERANGVGALAAAICKMGLYIMERNPALLNQAEDMLETARITLPPEAARALRAREVVIRALAALRADKPGKVALPASSGLFVLTLDPKESHTWTPLLVDEHLTVKLKVQGYGIDAPWLDALMRDTPSLTQRLPFETYDPRLSLWLTWPMLMSWSPALMGASLIPLGRYREAEELLGRALKGVGVLPAAMYERISVIAVSGYVELVRAWSEALYRQFEAEENEPARAGRLVELNKVNAMLLVTRPADAGARFSVSSDSPLSRVPALAPWRNRIEQALPLDTGPASEAVPASMLAALHQLRRRMLMMQQGILASGKYLSVAPLWRFDHLFEIASFFVTQSKVAEQRAMDFIDRANSGTLQRQQFLDAIDMANSELAIAKRRVTEANAGVAVAQDNLTLARTRSDNAQTRINNYPYTAENIRQYQAMATSLGGGSTGNFASIQAHIDAIRRGGSTGEPGLLAAATTYLASTFAGEAELTTLRAQGEEAVAAIDLALTQLDAEHVRVEIARGYQEQATQRLAAARAMLKRFDEAVTSVPYSEMAAFMRRIAEAYFAMAIDSALAMQSAFNYQYRQEIELVTGKSRALGVKGQLASEDLALKLAQFRFFQLRLGDKRRLPVRWTLRLQNVFSEAMQRLRETGRTDFTLTPEHLRNFFPGLFNVSILGVRLKSSVGALGDRWVLTNSPKGRIRDITGATTQLAQTVEARIVSDYAEADRFKEDMLQARLAQNQLEPFENTSPLCTWSLRYAGRASDTNLGKVSIAVEFDLDAEYSPLLHDKDESQAGQRLTERDHLVAVTLSSADVRGLQALLAEGKAEVAIGFTAMHDGVVQRLFPEGAATMTLTDLGLMLLPKAGVLKSLDGVTVKLLPPPNPESAAAAQQPVSLATDAQGGVRPGSGGAAAPLLVGNALPIGTYRIELVKNAAGALNAGGLDLKDIADVGLVIGYRIATLIK